MVPSCKFVSDRIDKHLKNKHKELDENQCKIMLKLAPSYTQLPLIPNSSPVKKAIVKETCLSVVVNEELPVGIANDFHGANMEQTGADELRL